MLPLSPLRSLDGKVRENTPRLILNQFRWLEHVVNPRALAKELLDLLDCVVDTSIKREIVGAIPEIVDDSQHKYMVDELREKMSHDTDLISPVIECISHLSLKRDLLDDVRVAIMGQLALAKTDAVIVIVQFLLKTVTQETVKEVVAKLREDITFDQHPVAAGRPAKSQAKSGSRRGAGGGGGGVVERDSESLLLETLKSGLQFQKFIVEEWLTQVSQAGDLHPVRPLDLVVLFLLYSNALLRKRVVQIYRKKVEEGHCTTKALAELLQQHPESLRDHFPQLLSLAEQFLREPGALLRVYGANFYLYLFLAYEQYHRQEVVGAVVTHLGSGVSTEVDAGLSVLSLLAERAPRDLAAFSVFLQRIMDNLDDFSLDQVRQLFSVFNLVAHHVGDPEHFLSDINLVIRKQLSSDAVKYKRLGIVGGIALIRIPADDASQSGPSAPATEVFLRQASELFAMMMMSCKKHQSCFSLIYDELSVLVEGTDLDPQLRNKIKEAFLQLADDASSFEEYFVGSLEELETRAKAKAARGAHEGDNQEGEESSSAPEPRLAYSLLEEDTDIHIRLYSLMTTDTLHERERVQYLCSSFRLWTLVLKAENHGSLDTIAAVSGAALCLFKDPANFASLSLEVRETLCATVFLTLDWLREVLNAFVGQPEEQVQRYTLARVSHLVALEEQLKGFLQHTARFSVPGVSIPESVFEKGRKGKGRGKKEDGKARGKGKGKGKAKDEGEGGGDEKDEKDEKDADAETTEEMAHVAAEPLVTTLRAYMRELDLDVFNLLSLPPVLAQLEESAYDVDARRVSSFTAANLKFLLEDLLKKLAFKFSPQVVLPFKSAKKVTESDRNPFEAMARRGELEVANTFVLLLPFLCQHLEAINRQLQVLDQSQSSSVDFVRVSESQLAECLTLLFAVVDKFLRWPGMPTDMLKKALKSVGSRLSSGPFLTIADCATSAFTYFQKYVFYSLFFFSSSFHLLLHHHLLLLPSLIDFPTTCSFKNVLPSPSCATALFKLLEAICFSPVVFQQYPDLLTRLSTFAGELLRKKWDTPLKGEVSTFLVAELFRSEELLNQVENAITQFSAYLETEEPAKDYPQLRKDTVGVHYRVLFDALVRVINSMVGVTAKKASAAAKVLYTSTQLSSKQREKAVVNTIEISLERISTCIGGFSTLIASTKIVQTQSLLVYAAAIKYGRLFVDAFLKTCLPFFDDLLRVETKSIFELLKTFQKGTRTLHVSPSRC